MENTVNVEYVLCDKLPNRFIDDVTELLVKADDEFIPPLSTRANTTQMDFAQSSSRKKSIEPYLTKLLTQKFALAIEDGHVIGFISFIEDYFAEGVKIPAENIYISTICVDKTRRRGNVANSLYELLEDEIDKSAIYTRTWSTNDAHLGLLKKRGYKLIAKTVGDRADGIDSVYYEKNLERHRSAKLRVKNKGSGNILQISLITIGVLFVVLTSAWIYSLLNPVEDTPWYVALLSEASIALFISGVILSIESFFAYNREKSDLFFRSLKEYGIEHMHHGKKSVLKKLLSKNGVSRISLSGYRLLVTLEIAESIIQPLLKNPDSNLQILACPPWSTTYQQIFDDDATDVYVKLLQRLDTAGVNLQKQVSFRFTDNPIFNDTVIVDDFLITSPYMHNYENEVADETNLEAEVDKKASIIGAEEFFCIEVKEKSPLFKFYEEDFLAVWKQEATKELLLSPQFIERIKGGTVACAEDFSQIAEEYYVSAQA